MASVDSPHKAYLKAYLTRLTSPSMASVGSLTLIVFRQLPSPPLASLDSRGRVATPSSASPNSFVTFTSLPSLPLSSLPCLPSFSLVPHSFLASLILTSLLSLILPRPSFSLVPQSPSLSLPHLSTFSLSLIIPRNFRLPHLPRLLPHLPPSSLPFSLVSHTSLASLATRSSLPCLLSFSFDFLASLAFPLKA